MNGNDHLCWFVRILGTSPRNAIHNLVSHDSLGEAVWGSECEKLKRVIRFGRVTMSAGPNPKWLFKSGQKYLNP